jgi:hypothetical protein
MIGRVGFYYESNELKNRNRVFADCPLFFYLQCNSNPSTCCANANIMLYPKPLFAPWSNALKLSQILARKCNMGCRALALMQYAPNSNAMMLMLEDAKCLYNVEKAAVWILNRW